MFCYIEKITKFKIITFSLPEILDLEFFFPYSNLHMGSLSLAYFLIYSLCGCKRCLIDMHIWSGNVQLASYHGGDSLGEVTQVQFSSVAQLCPTHCDPTNCSTPGLPVHHQLLESTQTCPLSQWCHPTISSSVVPFSSCPPSSPASGSFQMSQLFASDGPSIGILASKSVLPMNTQDWSPLGWTGWISLQSKGLSTAFSTTTVQKHKLFCSQLSLLSISHIHTWPLEQP